MITLKELMESTNQIVLHRVIFKNPIRLEDLNSYLDLIDGEMPYEIDPLCLPLAAILVRRYTTFDGEDCIVFQYLSDPHYNHLCERGPSVGDIEQFFIEPKKYDADKPFYDQFHFFEELWKNIQEVGIDI